MPYNSGYTLVLGWSRRYKMAGITKLTACIKMDSSSIKMMNKTKILQLSKWQLFWHYFIGLIPLSIGILNLYWLIKIHTSEKYNGILTEKGIISTVIFCFLLALLVFIIERRRLNFIRIDISLNEIEFTEKMLEIAETENWNLLNNTKKYAVFYNGSAWTWGLKMTVLRFENYLLVNSICDLDSKPCISIFSENERNIKRFKKNLLKPVANRGLGQ